jgi:hypothetical protein
MLIFTLGARRATASGAGPGRGSADTGSLQWDKPRQRLKVFTPKNRKYCAVPRHRGRRPSGDSRANRRVTLPGRAVAPLTASAIEGGPAAPLRGRQGSF